MNEHHPQPEHGNKSGHQPSREHEYRLVPRIWIGSLADYNNGTLTGEWVDAAVEDEELLAAARRIVARSEDPTAEEYAIFDHDDFGDFTPGEYEQLSLVAKVARGIRDHGPAFAVWADLHDADPDMLEAFEDSYLGEYDSPEDWAREITGADQIEADLTKDLGPLAQFFHFDADAFARDAWLSGDVHIAHKDEGGCWVFASS